LLGLEATFVKLVDDFSRSESPDKVHETLNKDMVEPLLLIPKR